MDASKLHTLTFAVRPAALVRQASARFPSSWVAEADRLGELRVHASKNTRGYSYTEKMDRDQFGLLLTLPGFGRMYDVKKGTGFIQVRSWDIGNAVHEYAHRLQAALPELDRIFQLLHHQRVLGQPLRSLSDLMPESGYGRDELTREDSYTDPYQGKEYVSGVPVGSEHVPPGAAMEVMTMGFETVLGLAAEGPRMAQSVSRFRRMYLEDREMFDFVVGLLRHWKP